MEDMHTYLVAWVMFDDVELMSESFFTRAEAEAYRRMLINKKGKQADQVRILVFFESQVKGLLELYKRLHRALDVEDSKVDTDWDGWNLLSDSIGRVAREVLDATGKPVGEHLANT